MVLPVRVLTKICISAGNVVSGLLCKEENGEESDLVETSQISGLVSVGKWMDESGVDGCLPYQYLAWAGAGMGSSQRRH